MKKIFLFIIIILSIRCANKGVEGIYHRKLETLQLDQNNNFKYDYRLGWNVKEAEGNWSLDRKKKAIILRSSYKFDRLPLEVKEEIHGEDSLFFFINPISKINSSFSDSVRFSLVIDDFESKITQHKRLKYSRNNIRSFYLIIYFPYDPDKITPFVLRNRLSTCVYQIVNGQANSFTIKFPLEDKMFFSEEIESDTLQIKHKKIYWISKGEIPFKRSKKL